MDIPFQIKGLEEKIRVPFRNMMLYGSIDRVDEADGITRIIDYKTGHVDIKSSTIEELFTNPDKKALFQLYFYALLYNLSYPGKPVKTGFYIARNLGSGITWSANGDVIHDEDLENFKNLLSVTLHEIVNSETVFEQTRDITQCTYCPYKTICCR